MILNLWYLKFGCLQLSNYVVAMLFVKGIELLYNILSIALIKNQNFETYFAKIRFSKYFCLVEMKKSTIANKKNIYKFLLNCYNNLKGFV